MIGTTILHYEIVEKLGEGGMGVVYKARDSRLGRHVALKFLPHVIGANHEARERLTTEARAAARLSHPNIAAVHAIEEAGDQTFIVMELVEGLDLEKILEDEDLPSKDVLRIATGIARALGAAHGHGIIHRDIKSANVMLSSDGTPKVTDFGLAKLRGGPLLTRDGSTIGTAAYMSPEQIRGEDVDHRSDVFSFGVVFYEMLAGHRPFKGDYESAVMYSIVNVEPEPLEDVPPELASIVMKALAKDREERYQEMGDLLADLESLTGGRRHLPGPRNFPRRPAAAAAGLAFLVAVALLLTLYEPGAPKMERRSVAVMYFRNLTNDDDMDWVQKGVVEMINMGLARSEQLYVMDTQRLFDILRDMRRENIQEIDETTASEIARRAEVGTMILGSILKIGDVIRLQIKLVDTASGELIASEHSDGGSLDDLFAIAADLTDRIRGQLEVEIAVEDVNELWMKGITTRSVDAFKYYVQGRDLLLRSHFAAASEKYQEAVRLDSTFVTAWAELAAAHMNLGEWVSMEKAYARARSLRERASPIERLNIDIIGAILRRDNEELIRLVEEMLDYDPKNNFWRFLLGRAHFFSDRLDAAIEIWEPLRQDGWRWVWTYIYLGNAYEQLDRFDRAVDVYRSGVEAVPEYTGLYALMSRAAAGGGDSARARTLHEQFFAETARLRPANAGEIYETAGFNYLRAGMIAEAAETFVAGVQALPDDARMHNGLGEVRRAEKRYGDAADAYLRTIELDPERYVVYYRLGLCYEALEKQVEAAEFFKQFVELREEGADVEDAKRRLEQIRQQHSGATAEQATT